MARIFNIYFPHDDLVHSAIVSVRNTPFFTEYTLSNFNEELLKFLPGNKIISKSPEHFMFQDATEQHSTQLMTAIIKAVTEHLHTSKA